MLYLSAECCHAVSNVFSFDAQLKVTRQNLVLLHNAFSAYYDGNYKAMKENIQELSSRLDGTGENDPPEWLEDLPSQREQAS